MILLLTMAIVSRGISKTLVTSVTSREKLILVSGERRGRGTLSPPRFGVFWILNHVYLVSRPLEIKT